MRNVITIFFLLIFTFNLSGGFLILKIQQYQIRREVVLQIKAGIPQEDLTTIVITSENKHLVFWQNDEEFSFNGVMYDIVHIEKDSKGFTRYHCLTDDQETSLIAKFSKENKKNNKHKNNRSNTAKIFKILQKINPIPQTEEIAFRKEYHKNTFLYLNNYIPISPEIKGPPPKIA